VRYLREFAGVGVLGSFTTFSAWMVELRDQADASEWRTLSLYLVGSIVLGLTASALGVAAGRIATTRRSRHVHTTHILSLSEDLPVAVVIVDAADRIEAFLPELDELVTEGLVMIDEVDVVMYVGRDSAGKG
jgi:Uncharacterized ACR, COG1993/CrcB-like protein, Camphor Resistance (CrcB)